MNNELYHYGVLGQKWGVRRYQPYPEGKHGKFLGQDVHNDNKSVKGNDTVKSMSKIKKLIKMQGDFNIGQKASAGAFLLGKMSLGELLKKSFTTKFTLHGTQVYRDQALHRYMQTDNDVSFHKALPISDKDAKYLSDIWRSGAGDKTVRRRNKESARKFDKWVGFPTG